MKVTDRYLTRATRGLWGQKKRDAMTELRGAIEDKKYRHRLCGLSESEAEQAALRDLGNPAVIARGLNRVHSGPQVAGLTLLLSVVGVLGVQAAAQIPTIHAAPVPIEEACRYDDAMLARFSPADRAMVQDSIRAAGGQAAYEAACRARQPDATTNDLLKLADLVAALRRAHIDVRTLPGLDAYLQLRLPGGDWQSLDLSASTVTVPSTQTSGATLHEPYFYTSILIQRLLDSFQGPVALTGVVNPTLHLGPAQMQLGTAQRPVRVTNLYLYPVMDQVTRLVNNALPASGPAPRVLLDSDKGSRPNHTRLAVGGAEGSLYALVGTAKGQLELMVGAVQGGHVELPCDCTAVSFAHADDLKTLLGWARAGKVGLLVYAIDASDLRHLTLTPVRSSAVRLVPAGK